MKNDPSLMRILCKCDNEAQSQMFQISVEDCANFHIQNYSILSSSPNLGLCSWIHKKALWQPMSNLIQTRQYIMETKQNLKSRKKQIDSEKLKTKQNLYIIAVIGKENTGEKTKEVKGMIVRNQLTYGHEMMKIEYLADNESIVKPDIMEKLRE